MYGGKGIRDVGLGVAGLVDDDRQQERPALRHKMRTLIREPPLKAEIPFRTQPRRARDNGYEQCAVANFAADFLVPGIAAAKLASIEPDLDARCPECLADTAGRLCILRGIADEDRLRSGVQCTQPFLTILNFPLFAPNGRG